MGIAKWWPTIRTVCVTTGESARERERESARARASERERETRESARARARERDIIRNEIPVPFSLTPGVDLTL